MKIMKAWIHQEIYFENQREFDRYKDKWLPRGVIIKEETPFEHNRGIMVVVKKPYNNNDMSE